MCEGACQLLAAEARDCSQMRDPSMSDDDVIPPSPPKGDADRWHRYLSEANVRLVPIDRRGTPRGYGGELPASMAEVFRATSDLYDSVGFVEPWVGYLALLGDTPVGTCAFKSPPVAGRVEIAYLTFPEFEGQGLATAMAAQLVATARRHSPSVVIAAQTLAARDASHRILEKLGFRRVATIDHPEDGMVWEWQLPPEPST